MTPTAFSRRLLVLAFAAALAVPAVAQDAGRVASSERPLRTSRDGERVERVKQLLDLSDQQAALIERLRDDHDPAAFWSAAAALSSTLTPPQAARIPQRPLHPDRSVLASGSREAAAPTRAARQRALDLTARQAEALHALEEACRPNRDRDGRRQDHAARRQERVDRQGDRRAAPPPATSADVAPPAGDCRSTYSSELSSILTPEQEQTWRVHALLLARVHERREGARPDRHDRPARGERPVRTDRVND